jgi:exosortase/archaeosortase family protein
MNRTSRWFAVRFIALLVVGNALMLVPAVDAWVLSPWTTLNTVAAAKLASVLGLPAQANGSVLSSDAASINVMQGCNGFHALLIYACAVFASPVGWMARLWGLIAGSVVIFGFNLVRLVNLLAVARYAPSRLELFHVYIWQTLIVILALATFIGWGVLIARRQTPDPQRSTG